MKVILVSFLLFGVAWAALNCECGKRNAGRIVGGKVAKKNEFPWMVAFTNAKTNFTYCGGTIVTPRHVVTAGHCANFSKSAFFITVGAHDVNDFTDSTRQSPPVEQIILHADFDNKTLANDIALLVTSTEIIFNEFVGPLCMPSGMSGYLNDEMVKAMGWGRYNPYRPNTDKIKQLREVDITIRSRGACNANPNGVNITNICTYDPDKSPCVGDSGGPLAWLNPDTNRYTFVGVISRGPNYCLNPYGINVNVLYYQDWINENIKRTVSTAVTCHKV